MTVTTTGIVGHCFDCHAPLHEGEYTIVRFSDNAAPRHALYCKNRCEPIAESKEEARVTLSDVPMMVARHYGDLRDWIDFDLLMLLTRDYHAHLLSIATVGNLPKEPTESGDDGWISIKSRMPELGEYVLVWLPHGLAPAVLVRGLSEDGASIGWVSPPEPVGLITHWQPLPGKPKGLE